MTLLRGCKTINVRTISKTFLKSLNYVAYFRKHFCKDNSFKNIAARLTFQKNNVQLQYDILQVLSFSSTFCELFFKKNITRSQNKN